MIINEIEKLLDLSSEEEDEFEENYFEYEDEIMELMDLYRKNQELIERKNRMHTKMARFSFDIYETWMELHKNAITLSSYRAEANLRSIVMELNFRKRMDELINRYVLIEKFA